MKTVKMSGGKLFLMLLLTTLVVVQSQNDKKCKPVKMKYNKTGNLLSLQSGNKKSNCSCKLEGINNFKGQYLCTSKSCSSNEDTAHYHQVIGFGAAIALLSILLLIVTGGWIWTCLIMRKTTEISIQPKSSARVIHQYDEHPLQPNNSISFQPSVKYSLLGHSYNSQLSQLSRSEMEEEQIYEVLDEEDNHLQKAKARGVNRGVTISGDKNGPYSKLEYSENSQSN